MHNSTKTASVRNGFNTVPIGGMVMPMTTSAATARVPCRPSHESTAAPHPLRWKSREATCAQKPLRSLRRFCQATMLGMSGRSKLKASQR
jgi:hypothetical protein